MLNNIAPTVGLFGKEKRKAEKIRAEKVKNDIKNFQNQFDECTIFYGLYVLVIILAPAITKYLESNKDLTDQEKNQLQEILKKITRLY